MRTLIDIFDWIRGHGRGRWLGMLPLLLVLAGTDAALAAQTQTRVRADDVKAAAVYNILAFTEWPPTAFDAPESPLVIGVLGEGPVADLLVRMVENETWRDRRIVLKRFAYPSVLTRCHVLYIAESAHDAWASARRRVALQPTLTVSGADNFARQGGIIQLAIERNKLSITVNLGVARESKIAISAKVLRLANVIGHESE